MTLTNEQIQVILDGAPEGIDLRHQNTNRNRALNLTVRKLSKIVNHHNPEVDVPIALGVWDCLDCVTSELEAPLLREILTLRQHAQELEAQIPKWISVGDGLPDDKQSVLVVVNGYGRHIDKYYKDKGFREFDGFVTHWMPLPPKEVHNV